MAMTLRLTDEQDRALTLLAEADGISKQEAACRAIIDTAARRTNDAMVRELSARGRTRYSDLIDRLSR
jgi:predicted transcriptional regulator